MPAGCLWRQFYKKLHFWLSVVYHIKCSFSITYCSIMVSVLADRLRTCPPTPPTEGGHVRKGCANTDNTRGTVSWCYVVVLRACIIYMCLHNVLTFAQGWHTGRMSVNAIM